MNQLARACARGRAAWPALAFSEERFARDLIALLGPLEGEALEAVALEDLFLARACVAGTAGAADAFRAKHRQSIRAVLSRVVPAEDLDDLEQQFLEELLLGSADNPPKIASYLGRAPLTRWISVGAHRAGLLSLRNRDTETRARNAAAAEPAPVEHPEVAFMKERYRGEFQRAMSEALGRLPERDRLLLKMYLVKGISVEKIGQMFSVSQATASRWLAAAREAVRDDMKKVLEARLGGASGEVASLAGMVASQLELSISKVLKTD